MRQYRYHIVVLSVTLTLWSGARAKSIASQGEAIYYPPPTMHWISDFTETDDQPQDEEIEREVSAIEW